MRDAGLHAQLRQVEHGDRRRLASRCPTWSGWRGAAASGPAGLRPPPTGALTYSMTGAGWETIRSATLAVSIAEPPPTETKPSTRRVARERRGLLERVERRLDAGAVEDDDLDPGGLDRGADALGMPGGGDARVGHEQRARDAEPRELPARVVRRARPELDRRGLEREDRLVHASRSSASRSCGGNATGRRVARSTNTCTNQPVADGLVGAVVLEHRELVAHARAADVAGAQSDRRRRRGRRSPRCRRSATRRTPRSRRRARCRARPRRSATR